VSEKKVVLVTGAARGMGVDIARAALTAGHQVVATARDAAKVTAVLGKSDDVLAVALDVTDPASIQAAVDAAVERFGRIDVLVNNAGAFQAGYFEQISPEHFQAQMDVNFTGPLNVTRAVLPLMRAQRSGVVLTITSTAGIVGGAFTSAYAASKFALEGFMESLAPEVAPFGIHTLTVEPGFFRTELLTPESTIVPDSTIEDYAAGTEATVAAFAGMNGQQVGDPAKLATALIELATSEQPPARFVAGADAMAAIEERIATLQAEIDAHRELSASLSYDA
jgi:NAD(P)-dependent dehydrogenase (short-subunit alcohol dehydrogenase family)